MTNQLVTFKVKDWVVFGRNIFQPPHKISDSLINEARIVYVINGRSRLYSANKYSELHSGDLLIMKTDNFINNWLKNEDNQSTQVIAFQLNSEFLKYLYQGQMPDWFKANDQQVDSALKVGSSPIISSFFEGLLNYLDNSELLTEELIQIKIKELIALMIQVDESGQIKKIFGNLFTATDYLFQEVIQQNLYENLNLEDIAFLTGMSLSSFKRKFSSVFGTTPNKYITSKRLEKAQILLTTSQMNITEIAYECGFSDVGYFSKTFRKYYNSSPSDLRSSGVS